MENRYSANGSINSDNLNSEQTAIDGSIKVRSDKVKIVIVDDNESCLADYVDILEEYKPVTFTNAEEALKQIPSIAPDIIICDLILGDGNGAEICRDLRKYSSLSNSKFLIISGMTDVIYRVTGYKFGIDDYLTKPIDPRELKAKISAMSRSMSK